MRPSAIWDRFLFQTAETVVGLKMYHRATPYTEPSHRTATDTVFERARARICGLDPLVHHTVRPNACECDYVMCTVCSVA